MANVQLNTTPPARLQSSAASLSPSEQKIVDIEKKYTGKNFDPAKMISSADVAAAICALSERHGPDVGGRAQLAGLLYAFGGTDVHPEDHFQPQDKAAMKAAILKGIASPAALAKQPKQVQAAVLDRLAFYIPQPTLGLNIDYSGKDLSVIDNPAARAKVAQQLAQTKPPKGYGPTASGDFEIERSTLNGESYGYRITATYPGPKGNSWSVELTANALGDVVARSAGFSYPQDQIPEG